MLIKSKYRKIFTIFFRFLFILSDNKNIDFFIILKTIWASHNLAEAFFFISYRSEFEKKKICHFDTFTC